MTKSELPDPAQEAGRALTRKQAADRLLAVAERIEQTGAPPMPLEEIDAEVKKARALTRAARAASAPAFARVWSNPEDDAYDS